MSKLAILLIIPLLVSLTIPVYAESGITFYEQGNLKIAVEELTTGLFYDLRAEDFEAGAFTPLIQYKTVNLDVGIINGVDSLDDTLPSPFIGVSSDIAPLDTIMRKYVALGWNKLTGAELNPAITTQVGTFVSLDISDGEVECDDWGYGVYAGLKVSF